MKITLDRLAVKDALKIGRRPLDTRSAHSMPATLGARIFAGPLGVTFERTDLGVFSSVTTDAEVHDDGEVLAKAKPLREAVQRGDDQVTLVFDGDKLTVTNGAVTLTVPTYDLSEWPKAPALDGAQTMFSEEAWDRLTRIARAAGTDDNRKVLTGVHFHEQGVAATDSYRLHFAEGRPGAEGVLVPAELILGATKEAKRTSGFAVTAETGDDNHPGFVRINFDTGRGRGGERELHASYTAKLIEGTYPSWPQLLPDDPQGEAVFSAEALLDAIKAVEVVTKQHRNVSVRYYPVLGKIEASFDESKAEVDVPSKVTAAVESPVNRAPRGQVPHRIAFNPEFLAEAVEAVDAERVSLSLSTALKPGVLTDADGDGDVTALVMPKRT